MHAVALLCLFLSLEPLPKPWKEWGNVEWHVSV